VSKPKRYSLVKRDAKGRFCRPRLVEDPNGFFEWTVIWDKEAIIISK
jgi:hypothetical protein